MAARKLFYVILLLLGSFPVLAQQTILGKVIDAETKTPLYGVSIYFDGTTLGTITDKNGKFELTAGQSTETPLLISFLGYKTVAKKIHSTDKTVDLGIIPLKKSEESLGTVYIENDTWSREKKMNYFKRWFLGKGYADKGCEIMNEDDIKLRFHPSENKLTVFASKPLKIQNDYLGYNIRYTLTHFVLTFEVTRVNKIGKKHYRPFSCFYSGQSFFKELEKRVRRRFRRRRKKAYKGSQMEFLRALATKTLKKEHYQIFYQSMRHPAYEFFDIKPQGKLTEVKIKADRLAILYDKDLRTDIIRVKKPAVFYIDAFGNYTPSNLFYFQGEMAQRRVMKMLPLDYGLE